MRKVPKQEKMMRMNLLIIVVALIAVSSVLQNKQKGVVPKLEFTQNATQSCYQLQRTEFKGNAMMFVPAGEVEFSSDNVIFTLTGSPLYPWEENKADEFTDRIWLEYNNIIEIAAKNSQNPIGILEIFGEYYLAVEDKGEKIFYTLTDLLPVDSLGYDEIIMVAESYKKKSSPK